MRLCTAFLPFKEMGVLEREGAAYGGYGGVYVHDYRGPMIQTDQPLLQDFRRSSKGSLADHGRTSHQEEAEFVQSSAYDPITAGGGYGVSPSVGRISPSRILDSRVDMGHPYPPEAPRGRLEQASTPVPCDLPRRSSLKKSTVDKYGAPAPRASYVPLNNESRGDRAAPLPRKPADLTIINNTIASPPQLPYKNINAHANLSASSSLVDTPHLQHSILRRGSEPPRPIGRMSTYLKNRSFDDLGSSEPSANEEDLEQPSMRNERRDSWRGTSLSSICSAASRRGDEREGARTISRAHLRRDSFGEVVSRRSPSQDSLEMSRTRSSPEVEDGDAGVGGFHSTAHDMRPGEDIWSCAASSRHSPSQDSLHRHVSNRRKV